MSAPVLVSSRAEAQSAHRSGVTCVPSSQGRANLRFRDRCTQQVRACPSVSPVLGRADLIHLPVSSQGRNSPAFQGGKCWQSLKPSPVVLRSPDAKQGALARSAANDRLLPGRQCVHRQSVRTAWIERRQFVCVLMSNGRPCEGGSQDAIPGYLSMAGVNRPLVTRVTGPCWRPVDGRMLVGGWRVEHLLVFEQGSVQRGRSTATLILGLDLVAGLGQPVEGAACENWGVKQAQPSLVCAARGDP